MSHGDMRNLSYDGITRIRYKGSDYCPSQQGCPQATVCSPDWFGGNIIAYQINFVKQKIYERQISQGRRMKNAPTFSAAIL